MSNLNVLRASMLIKVPKTIHHGDTKNTENAQKDHKDVFPTDSPVVVAGARALHNRDRIDFKIDGVQIDSSVSQRIESSVGDRAQLTPAARFY